MNILFINKFVKPDYLNDCMFYGFTELGVNIETTANPLYMSENFTNKLSLYGRGFTIWCNLKSLPPVEPSPQEKIKDRYYDFIVYGSIHRDASFLNEVLSTYSKDKILVLDGEDHSRIQEYLVNKVRYYKRENVENRSDVESISFSIPEIKITNDQPTKRKLYGTVIPGNIKTYVFYDEKEYYDDYANSFYGFTWKKGGWDCMRHYEIMAAGSIPCFRDLDSCPKGVMKNFPKDLILEMNKYSLKAEVPSNYFDVQKELIDYTRSNLTTKKAAKEILQ